MITVLHVVPAEENDILSQIQILAAALPADEFSFHTALLQRHRGRKTASPSVPEEIKGISLHRRFPCDPGFFRDQFRLLNHIRPDIIHDWCRGEGSSFPFSRIWPNNQRPHIILSPPGLKQSACTRWGNRLLNRMQPAPLIVLPFSQENIEKPRSSTKQCAGVTPTVIPPGVPLPNLGEEQRRRVRNALCRRWGIPPSYSLIGTAGPLNHESALCELVWGLQLLQQLRERVCLVVMGDGSQRKKAEALARHFGCTEWIRFTKRMEDFSRCAPAFDVYWQAGCSDRTPYPLLQAMAAGVPVVAAQNSVPPEILRCSSAGLWMDGSGVSFAKMTDRLLANPPLQKELGLQARQLIALHFSPATLVQRYAELYRLLSQQRSIATRYTISRTQAA